MLSPLLNALKFCGLSIVVCAVLYPAAMLVVAQAVVPEQCGGSLVRDAKGTIVGSRFVAQAFTKPGYFWPRPSACGYDASASAGSNLSPKNPAVGERAAAIIESLDLGDESTPADLVTSSGSGLDPHVSLASARAQIARVAFARGIDQNAMRELVDRLSDRLPLEDGDDASLVNVLEINLALDESFPGS